MPYEVPMPTTPPPCEQRVPRKLTADEQKVVDEKNRRIIEAGQRRLAEKADRLVTKRPERDREATPESKSSKSSNGWEGEA